MLKEPLVFILHVLVGLRVLLVADSRRLEKRRSILDLILLDPVSVNVEGHTLHHLAELLRRVGPMDQGPGVNRDGSRSETS